MVTSELLYLRQLARQTNITLGAVQRELRQLVGADLAVRKTVGHQTFYSANQASPALRGNAKPGGQNRRNP